MKPIEGVDLGEVTASAAKELLDERLRGVHSLVKSKLNELNQSAAKIGDLEKQLTKERQRAEKLQKWLDEVRSGNWAVLDLSEKQEEGR